MPVLHCPICRRKVPYESTGEVPCRPFCSRRCKLIDLGRWLNEEYRITEESSLAGGQEPSGRGGDDDPESAG